MKLCPLCDTAYPNHHTNCNQDGAMLIESKELELGAIIRNKYRIVRVLGRGGMGTVYLAEHILLGQQRALKFISGELSHDPRFLKRFRQEAQAAIRLRHPNVVEVVDLDQAEDGSPYIAMEYVDGPGLRQALSESPFGVERALQIARGIALGLGAAHANGIVHRDVKPENILLAREGGGLETPKLLDFGIASMKETATAVSRTRGLMLTPEYAAPEQWKGMPSEELDGRTDLYALGGLLHEMLTGQTSFHSHSTEGWMYQHLQTELVAPSRLCAELAVWQGLDALVLRPLAKDREDRPANVAEFVRQLDAVRRKTSGRQAAEQAWVRAETVVEVDRRTALEEGIKTPKVGTEAPFFGQQPDSPPPKSRAKYVLATVALIAATAVVAAAYFAMHPTNDRLSRLKTKDWSQVHYDDTDFVDCLGVDGCLTKKARAARLTALSADEWKNLGLDNQVLQDCMGYPPCVERRIQADRLMATTDWQHADKKLLANCMHYQPCTQSESPNHPGDEPPGAASVEAGASAKDAIESMLDNWAQAHKSNNPMLMASFYGSTLTRYFLMSSVDNAFVIAENRRIVARTDPANRLKLFELLQREIDFSSPHEAEVNLIKHWILLPSSEELNVTPPSEQSVRSRLTLTRIDGQWKIVSERDFKD